MIMHDKKIDVSGIKKTSDKIAKEINSGVGKAESELENLSFVKGSKRSERRKDDPFNQIGL